MNAIRANEFGLSSWALVEDIFRLGLNCNSVSFSFVKREGNYVTHSLTKFAKFVVDYVAWLKHPPN